MAESFSAELGIALPPGTPALGNCTAMLYFFRKPRGKGVEGDTVGWKLNDVSASNHSSNRPDIAGEMTPKKKKKVKTLAKQTESLEFGSPKSTCVLVGHDCCR